MLKSPQPRRQPRRIGFLDPRRLKKHLGNATPEMQKMSQEYRQNMAKRVVWISNVGSLHES
jgi:hypothetical protein